MTKHLDVQKIIQDSLIVEAELALHKDVNPRTLQRWVAQGRFPKPLFIRKSRFYLKDEVAAWERERSGKAVRPLAEAARLPEYMAYQNAMQRCNNPNHPQYKYYGARGIEFRYTSFAQFLADVGRRPEGKLPSGKALYSIHRINNDGHYEPGNVRWATWKEQHAPSARRRKVRP